MVGDRELPIEWVIYDDEFNAARTAQLTERMISTDKVDCIVGTYGTAPVLAQGAIAGRYNKITIQGGAATRRSEEHTSELQSLMRISYAVFCLKKKNKKKKATHNQ